MYKGLDLIPSTEKNQVGGALLIILVLKKQRLEV